MKNKWAALAVCALLLIASVGYYYFTKSRSTSDVMGIEKNWWDDPTSQESAWIEQNRGPLPKTAKAPVEQVEEEKDHYTEMVEFKSNNSKRFGQIKQEIAELQGRLRSASSQQEANDLAREINNRKQKLKEIKEDDEFIQLLTGQ